MRSFNERSIHRKVAGSLNLGFYTYYFFFFLGGGSINSEGGSNIIMY